MAEGKQSTARCARVGTFVRFFLEPNCCGYFMLFPHVSPTCSPQGTVSLLTLPGHTADSVTELRDVLLTLDRRDLLQQIEVDVQKKWEENKAETTCSKGSCASCARVGNICRKFMEEENSKNIG